VARSVARLIDIELHGTGYVLGRTYKTRGISKHGLLRKVGEMRRSGWRIAEADYERVLDYLRRLFPVTMVVLASALAASLFILRRRKQ